MKPYIKYKNMKHNPIARKNLTEFDGKQDMGLKIDVCSLYLLNISKHHIFTTQYGYLIGAGMK